MVIQRAKELKPILLVETASLKTERVEPRTNAIPRTPDFFNLLEEKGANILSEEERWQLVEYLKTL